MGNKLYTDTDLADAIVCEVERGGIMLCRDYLKWVECAMALATTFGAEGENYFVRITQACDYGSNKFPPQTKYRQVLKSNRGKHTFATFIQLAKDAGVDVDGLRKQLSKDGRMYLATKPSQPQRVAMPVRKLYIPMREIEACSQHGIESDFCQAMLRKPLGDYKPNFVRAVQEYMIGRTNDGKTITPYLNYVDGNLCCGTGQVINFLPNGHRTRNNGHEVDWLHTRYISRVLCANCPKGGGKRCKGYKTCEGFVKACEGYNAAKCLFGMHLLKRYPRAIVCVVESAKTAILGRTFFPHIVWISTGGAGGFTEQNLAPLAYRIVMVIPDADMVAEWAERMKKMPFAANWKMSDWVARSGREGTKDDIADWWLECLQEQGQSGGQPHEQPAKSIDDVLEGMSQQNPAIRTLCSLLDLSIDKAYYESDRAQHDSGWRELSNPSVHVIKDSTYGR